MIASVIGALGSSPRLRGAHIAFIHIHAWCGIIPALAGSTKTPWHRTPTHGDHPRACGEHAILTNPHIGV